MSEWTPWMGLRNATIAGVLAALVGDIVLVAMCVSPYLFSGFQTPGNGVALLFCLLVFYASNHYAGMKHGSVPLVGAAVSVGMITLAGMIGPWLWNWEYEETNQIWFNFCIPMYGVALVYATGIICYELVNGSYE